MTADPKLISSRHNGRVTRDGVTVEICIYRLEHTKWTLEVVDAEGTSTVWDGKFDTEDDAFAEFNRTLSVSPRQSAWNAISSSTRQAWRSARSSR